MRALKTMPFLLALSCASPSLQGVTFTCETDADCTGGLVCGKLDGHRACMEEVAEEPSESEPLRIGLSAPLQGPSQGLGIEMRRGIEALFERVNEAGGVHGRSLQLESMNDNYDPDDAYANMLELLDIQAEVADPDTPDERGDEGVFALLGNVGTPTMLRTAPVANKNRVIFFAPFTGSHQYLRDGTHSPYVYNYRAGYYEEIQAMIDYIATFRQPRIISDPPERSYERIIAFTQRDSYGDAGYEGLVNAYNRIAPLPQPDSSEPDPSIARVYYERENVASVEPAIEDTKTLLTNLSSTDEEHTSVAILMVDTYQPGNKYIRAIKDWINEDVARAERFDVLFMHVSFVGSDSLSAALTNAPETYVDVRDGTTQRSYAEGVLVTQVVPYYDSQAPAIKRYREDLDAYDSGVYTFTSLEGYVAATLFVEALRLNGPELDTDSMLDTLDNEVKNLDVGIGTLLDFSSTDHQATHTVWGSVLQADGSFEVPFTWDPENRIQP
jgi:ABC-type branched-subunit amino acid transport system substrate-binding protein